MADVSDIFRSLRSVVVDSVTASHLESSRLLREYKSDPLLSLFPVPYVSIKDVRFKFKAVIESINTFAPEPLSRIVVPSSVQLLNLINKFEGINRLGDKKQEWTSQLQKMLSEIWSKEYSSLSEIVEKSNEAIRDGISSLKKSKLFKDADLSQIQSYLEENLRDMIQKLNTPRPVFTFNFVMDRESLSKVNPENLQEVEFVVNVDGIVSD